MLKIKQRGAVSIFIVIFTALLITVISTSFIRIMVKTQQQAVISDLSQSAYDSALAGVEDAKRLLVMYEKDCKVAATPAERCANLDQLLRVSTPCNTLQQAGVEGDITDKEVLIEKGEGDRALDQAYTCVKVMIETDDYIGTVNVGNSRLVPLKGKSDFNQVVLEWYSQVDLQNSTDKPGEKEINVPDFSASLELPKRTDWNSNTPPLMRAQLIQFGDNFKLSDFNKTAEGTSNAHTLFFYPNIAGRSIERPADFSTDVRLSQSASVIQPVACERDFSTTVAAKKFACSVAVQLPAVVGANDTARHAYLRLDPLYNNLTHFSVHLRNNGERVKFKDVQPIVDSTGRANDLFRRVQSRIELESDLFIYPQAAVDVTSSFCKTFLVTDRPADFNPGLCDSRS